MNTEDFQSTEEEFAAKKKKNITNGAIHRSAKQIPAVEILKVR